MHFSCRLVCLSDEENGWKLWLFHSLRLDSIAQRARRKTVKLIGAVDAFPWFTLLQLGRLLALKDCCRATSCFAVVDFSSPCAKCSAMRFEDTFPHVAAKAFLNYWSCVDSREWLRYRRSLWSSFFHNLAEELHCCVLALVVWREEGGERGGKLELCGRGLYGEHERTRETRVPGNKNVLNFFTLLVLNIYVVSKVLIFCCRFGDARVRARCE